MTYGVNAPLGAQSSSYWGSAPWTGGIQAFPITATYNVSLFTGDLVTFTSGLLTRYVPGNGATAPVAGVFIGCQYRDSSGVYQFSPYWPASTAVFTGTTATANVIVDPNTIFDIQANGAVAATSINKNAEVSFTTSGSTATGQSGMTLDTSTNPIATTSTFPLHIIAFSPVPGNIAGVTYNNLLVKLNNSSSGAGATGV